MYFHNEYNWSIRVYNYYRFIKSYVITEPFNKDHDIMIDGGEDEEEIKGLLN